MNIIFMSSDISLSENVLQFLCAGLSCLKERSLHSEQVKKRGVPTFQVRNNLYLVFLKTVVKIFKTVLYSTISSNLF